MKGDFTRDTFDRSKHFSRVLMQQGRVQLDSDWNEQAAIQQHRSQSLAKDLIGAHGWPGQEDDVNLGFGIVDVPLSEEEEKQLEDVKILPLAPGDFLIGRGRYYVDGILCENEAPCSYFHQPDWPGQPDLARGSSYLVYLDVWERHITSLEDMLIRESALGALGPDTATRAKTVWQVKVTDKLVNDTDDTETDISAGLRCENVRDKHWKNWLAKWQPENRGMLKARAIPSSPSDPEDACITPPNSRYRGTENQLYRVEIHRSGKAGTATFKWSRDNGSVVFPVREFGGGTVTLGDLGRDDFHTLEPGQWVELVDDDMALREEENPLGKIKEVRPDDMMVIVDWPQDFRPPLYDDADYQSKHVLLRRWDHRRASSSARGAPEFDSETGTLCVEESAPDKPETWLTLEQGIQISFTKAKSGKQHWYRSGDYWLIPARTATGDVEWPGEVGKPDPLPPHGVEHHYAPLALIRVGGDGKVATNGNDCRQKIGRGIDPGSDLQVKNLQVNGNLMLDGRNVAAAVNAFDNGIAALHTHLRDLDMRLAANEYDLGSTAMGQVIFLGTEVGRNAPQPQTIPGITFPPKLIFAHGICNAVFGERLLGGMVWSFADFRDGRRMNSCTGFSLARSRTEWTMAGLVKSSLLYVLFNDSTLLDQPRNEEITIDITNEFPLQVTLKRQIFRQPFDLQIFLNLYCLG
jgi:hypothetical protein